MTRPDPAPTARCPYCDHDFAAAEIADGWCEPCGRRIPEVVLKEVRPRPHFAPPPPPPEPTEAERAEARRTDTTRAIGAVIMILGLLVCVGAAAWIAYCRFQRADAGRAFTWIAGAGGAAFLFGLALLIDGRASDQ